MWRRALSRKGVACVYLAQTCGMVRRGARRDSGVMVRGAVAPSLAYEPTYATYAVADACSARLTHGAVEFPAAVLLTACGCVLSCRFSLLLCVG